MKGRKPQSLLTAMRHIRREIQAELGNCLTHAYHSEVRRVLSMLGSAAQMAASSVQRLQAEMNALRPEPPTLMV